MVDSAQVVLCIVIVIVQGSKSNCTWMIQTTAYTLHLLQDPLLANCAFG